MAPISGCALLLHGMSEAVDGNRHLLDGLPRGAFRLISGSLKSHERAGHAGTRNVGHFCPECGVRIYHEDPHQDYVRLKAGTLNHASELEPDAHINGANAPAW